MTINDLAILLTHLGELKNYLHNDTTFMEWYNEQSSTDQNALDSLRTELDSTLSTLYKESLTLIADKLAKLEPSLNDGIKELQDEIKKMENFIKVTEILGKVIGLISRVVSSAVAPEVPLIRSTVTSPFAAMERKADFGLSQNMIREAELTPDNLAKYFSSEKEEVVVSPSTVKIIRADWDLRPKTKFLTVEGYVTVESPDDEVTAEIAIPPGTNPEILLINVTVEPSNGPKKPQPAPFYFRKMTEGTEPWKQVQVVVNGDSETMRITTLQWAGEDESTGTARTATGTSKEQNLQEAINAAVSKALEGTAPDAGVSWKLESVTGRAGTFTGAQDLTVEVSFETPAVG